METSHTNTILRPRAFSLYPQVASIAKARPCDADLITNVEQDPISTRNASPAGFDHDTPDVYFQKSCKNQTHLQKTQ
jgi:hypothetical protein